MRIGSIDHRGMYLGFIYGQHVFGREITYGPWVDSQDLPKVAEAHFIGTVPEFQVWCSEIVRGILEVTYGPEIWTSAQYDVHYRQFVRVSDEYQFQNIRHKDKNALRVYLNRYETL